MKKLLLLFAVASAAFAASTPGGKLGVAVNPSGALSFLRVNAQGALLLAQLGPGASPVPPGQTGVALDPDGNVAFLHVDSSGGLIVSGAATSGPITTSGLTMSTATILGRTTAGTGAIEELTASAVRSFLSISIASGKTLTVSNSITFAGTDGTTMTFPSTSATIARTDAGNTFVGHQTIEGVTSTGATGTGKFVFDNAPTITTPTVAASTWLKFGAANTIFSAGGTGLLIQQPDDVTNILFRDYLGNTLVTITPTGAVTSLSYRSGTPAGGVAATWKLGAIRTGAGLAVSSTSGVQVDVGGTLVTLAVLTTNP